MKIEVWTDLVCPLCYIGKRQLELALEQMSFKEHVLIEYKSFEIYSNQSNEQTKKLNDILIEQYDLTHKNINDFVEQAKKVGILYQLDLLLHVDTFDAHRFLKYACTQNKANEVVERLLQGYFIKKEALDDVHTYMKVCEELSFDKEEVTSLLTSNKFSRAVKYDQIEAKEIGIKYPPYFLFNEEFALPGIQSVEVFKRALELTWEYMGKKPSFTINRKTTSKTTYCIGDDCDKDL